MQHEVLRAILGHAGARIAPPLAISADHHDAAASAMSPSPQHYECTTHAKCSLSQAEVTSINSTVQYGGHVTYLRCFVRQTEMSFCNLDSGTTNRSRSSHKRNGKSSRDSPSSPSLYRYAIGRAISTILDGYETKLLEVETQLRLDHCLGVEYIRATALPATAWIPHVSGFVCTSLLQGSCSSNNCAIIDEIDRRMTYCTDEEGRAALETILAAANAVLQNQCMRWILHGQLSDPANEFFIVRCCSKDDGAAVAANDDDSEQDRFELRRDRIPYSSVSFSLARRMLFVGRAVRTLEQYGERDQQSSLKEQLLQQHASTTGSLKLHLERTVSSAYDDVSCRLCDMLRNKFHLLKHLNNMYKLHLHGDGLFYSELLRECDAKGVWSKIAQFSAWGGEIDVDEWSMLGGRRMFQQHIVAPVLSRLGDMDSLALLVNADVDPPRDAFELSSFDIDLRKGLQLNAAGQAIEEDLFESSQDAVSHLSHTDELRLALSSAHDQVSSALSWLDGDLFLLGEQERNNRAAVILTCQYKLPPPSNASLRMK